MSNDKNSANNYWPPRAAATDPEQAVQSDTTGAAAASGDLWDGYTADASGSKVPQGKLWVEFEAVTTDVYFRLCRTALTATTTATGWLLKVGEPQRFYLDPRYDLFIDHIAPGGAGTIKWRKVGPIGERSRQ